MEKTIRHKHKTSNLLFIAILLYSICRYNLYLSVSSWNGNIGERDRNRNETTRLLRSKVGQILRGYSMRHLQKVEDNDCDSSCTDRPGQENIQATANPGPFDSNSSWSLSTEPS